MKGRKGTAVEHLVPLSSAAQEVIASVPRYRGAPFLFSYSAGKRPLAMTGQIKSFVVLVTTLLMAVGPPTGQLR